MRNPYNHIDMRVRDMAAVLPFYVEFLGALGFLGPEEVVEPDGRVWQNFRFRHGPLPSQFFGLIEDGEHRPNDNCLAFHVPTRQRVDEVARLAAAAGGQVEEPVVCPEYGREYYAAFLKDPSGNRLEVCCFLESDGAGRRPDIVRAVEGVVLPDSYSIRAWRRQDVEAVGRLTVQGEDENRLAAWAGSWPALVVVHGRELVGCLRAISDFETTTQLIEVQVDPAHRGLGLDRALVEVCQRLVPRTRIDLNSKSERAWIERM